MKMTDGGHGFSSKAAVIGSLVLVAATIGFHIVVATGRARFPFDYEGFHFPLLHLNAQILWSFELPAYNPFVYAGLPYHNSVQAGFWYPPHAVFALLAGFVGGPTLFQAQALNLIHFALGAIGTMLLLRELHVGFRAALTAGLLLIVNGHVLAQAQHLGVVETMAWLPLALLGVGRIVRAPSRASVTLLGAVLAMPMLIGFLPMALAFYVIIFGAMAYAVTRSAFRRQAILACGGSVLIAAGLCGPVVLPMLATLGQAVDLSPHGSMPPKMLATLLAPNVFGQFGPIEHYRGVFDLTVDYLFMGTAACGVAVSSIVCGTARAKACLAMSVACGVVTFGPTALASLVHSVPLVGALFRPFMFAFPMMLFAVMAVAFVIDRQSLKVAPFVCAIAVLGSGLVCSACWSAPAMSDPLIPSLVGTIVAASLTLLTLLLPTVRAWALCVLVVAEPATINFDRMAWSYPGTPNVHSATSVDGQGQVLLERMRGTECRPHRVAVDQQFLGGPWNGYWPVWGIECINGFDPLLPNAYFDEVRKRLATWRTDRLFAPGNLDDPLFETLNVRYLLTVRPIESARWRPVMTEGRYHLHEYVSFRDRYELVPMEAVSGEPPYVDGAQIKPGVGRGSVGNVSVVNRTMSSVRLRVDCTSRDAFLVIRDRAFPDWRVIVDGERVEPVVVDRLVMGLVLGSGTHEVELAFVPRSLLWGLAVAGATALACTTAVVAGMVTRRWRESPPRSSHPCMA